MPGTKSGILLLVVVAISARSLPDPPEERHSAEKSEFLQSYSEIDGGDILRHTRSIGVRNPSNAACRFDQGRNGTCMSRSRCEAYGGRSDDRNGYCDRLFSVCCLFQRSCGGVITQNNTLFVNPDFPKDTTEPQTCDVIVVAAKACYLRLDFKNFTVHDPIDGLCQVDTFYAPQLGTVVPRLCGYNNETHLYVYVKDIAQQQNVTLRLNLGEWGGGRQWMINVAAVDCNQDWTPPRGCLQYHMNNGDSIRSFNYHETSRGRSAMLAGLDYTVCVRQAPEKCHVRWTSDFFSLSPSNGTTAFGDSCKQNYVLIAQGFDNSNRELSSDRFCGETFGAVANSSEGAVVYSGAKPFMMQVRSSRSGHLLLKGFSLHYKQLQCV